MKYNELAGPRLLWTGASGRAVGVAADLSNDARVVMRTKLVKDGNDKEFRPELEVVYEAVAGNDAMGQPVWKAEPLGNIPVAFFVAACAAKT